MIVITISLRYWDFISSIIIIWFNEILANWWTRRYIKIVCLFFFSFSYLFERFCLAGHPLKVNSIFISITLSLKRFILLSCFNISCSIVLILCSSNNVFIFSYCSLGCVPFRLPSCELILFFCFWIFSEVSRSTMSCSSLIVYDLFVASSFLSKIVSESSCTNMAILRLQESVTSC